MIETFKYKSGETVTIENPVVSKMIVGYYEVESGGKLIGFFPPPMGCEETVIATPETWKKLERLYKEQRG